MPYLNQESEPKQGLQVDPTSNANKFDQKPTYAGEGIDPQAQDQLERTFRNVKQ